MQNNLKLLALSLFIVVSALRCSSSKDIEEVGGKNNRAGDVSFYADNTDISIKETDEKGSFAFKTEKALEKDVVIILSVKDKGVSLPVDKITLLAGATTAEGEVVFSKEMFEGVDDNLIEVTLTASSEDVSLDNVAVTYDVRKYIYGAPDVTITVDTANVEVFYENVPVKVTVQSNIPMPADATFALSIDGATEGVDCNFPDKNVTIKKGEKEGSVVLTLLKSSFVDGNPDKESGKPGDKAMDIGIKMKTTAAVNMAKSTVIVNAIGGFFTKTYCLPYMVSIASHYMRSFTIGDYTLDPPHLVDEKHYYADLRNSLENPIGRIEVPTGTSPLSFVTESRPNYGTANNIAVAWIDWNKDGDFLDEGEFVANIPYTASEANNGAVHTVDLTPPSFVKPGMSTVMRIGVIDKQGDTMTKSGGCGGSSQGDVVDVRIYIVKGADPVTYTGSLTDETVNVSGSDVVKTLVVTLPSDAEEEVEVDVVISGGNDTHYTLSRKSIIIPKGSKNGSATITFKKEFYQVALQNEDFVVELKPKNPYRYTAGTGTKGTLHVTGVGTKPTASLEVAATDITVPDGQDKVVNFKIKLSEPDNAKDVDVAIAVGAEFVDMVTLSATSVKIPKGTKEASLTLTFKASYFPFKNEIKNIPLTISSNNVLLDPKKETVTFKVQGSVVKPPLVKINSASSLAADVSNSDYAVSTPFWTNGGITQETQVEISFVGDNASKAYFEGGGTTKLLTFKPDGDKSVTEYVKLFVRQSSFAINQKGQTVTLHARAYGKSNIDFGNGAKTVDIVCNVTRREAGTYCPIVSNGDSEFYITEIKVGGKTVRGNYTGGYTDLTNEVFQMPNAKFEMEVTVHKNASVPNGTYELAVIIDSDNNFIMNDYWAEFMQLQKEDGSGSATSRTAILMDKADKTFMYKGQYDLERGKSRVRIALTRDLDPNHKIETNPLSGCMAGDVYGGTVVDVSWEKR